jgi:hypothetical protein
VTGPASSSASTVPGRRTPVAMRRRYGVGGCRGQRGAGVRGWGGGVL